MDLRYILWVSLFWLPFIICIFLVWYFVHRAKHKEKILMLEKGIDPQSSTYQRKGFLFPWFKIGIVIMGLSVGLIIISILISLKSLEGGGNTLPLAILGICGGGSMVLANRLDNDKNKS